MTTTPRQQQVLDLATAFGRTGITDTDVQEMTGWHHGSTSSALSVLHAAGSLARLAEKRDGQRVYVLPHLAADRPTQPYARRTRWVTCPCGCGHTFRA